MNRLHRICLTLMLAGALAACGQQNLEESPLESQEIDENNPSVTSDATAPTVSSTVPADGATSQATNTSVQIVFSEAMAEASITATSDSSCSGSIQLSKDNFATCVAIATVTANTDKKTFTLTPNSNLSYSTTYKIKVTTDATDAAGNGLSAAYASATGFTTGTEPDTTAPTVSSVSPTDGATGTALNTSIQVVFSEAMKTDSVSVADGCNGAVQLSADNFSTCVALNSSVTASSDSKTFTITPASNLTSLTNYKIKVTTSAKDAAGNALASDYTTSTGFTTADQTAPTVSSVSPTGTGISPSTTSFSVTFSEAMDTNSITADTTGTCSTTTLWFKNSDTNSCLSMTGVTASNSNKTFTATLTNALSQNTNYKIYVTTDAKDTEGNALAAAYTSAAFTTNQVYTNLSSPATSFSKTSCVSLNSNADIHCFGGQLSNGAGYGKVAIYNISTDTWSEFGTAFNNAYWDRRATTSDGTNVYIYGGTANGTTGQISHYLYYSVLVSSSTSGAGPRFGGTYTRAADNKGYYIGGMADSTTPLNTISIYNATWSNSGTTLNTARKYHTTSYANTQFYIIGGQGAATALNSIEEYYPGGASTTTKSATLNTSRYRHCAATINNKVYVFGGVNSSSYATASVEMYDAVNNTITQKTSLPEARSDIGCASNGTYIYLIGGRTNPASNSVASPTWRYDPSKDN